MDMHACGNNRLAFSWSLLLLSCTAGTCADKSYDLAFSTFFGGSAGDMIRDVEADSRGNLYVAGTTRSPDFPTTPGAYDEHLDTSAGTTRWGYNSDIFVAKFSPTGTLVWSTLVGGPNSEEAYGLEVDGKGYVIVHGRGAEGSPVTPGVYQPQFKGCGGGDPGNPHNTGQNAYICKLAPDGSALVWASFFGIDHLHRDLALDKNDDIYVTWGVRPGRNDPRHWGTWMDPAWNAHAFQPKPLGADDGGVAKIASDGKRVIWATYLGGSDYDSIEGSIDVDSQGYVYVGLQTRSKDIPTTPGAFDRTYNGGVDWYIAKLAPDGSRLVYGTYIGDEGDNWLNTHNLVVDSEGNCYSSTCAFSAAFPTTPGAVQRTCGGKVDWGLVKLSPTGALLAGTLLGGAAGDNPDGIRIDPQGNLVLFGQTGSADFPTSKNAFQPAKRSGNDAVIAKLSPDLDRILYSTFLGGSGDDNGRAGCFASDGSLIVAGMTSSSDWPTKNAWQDKLRDPSDALIARLSTAPPESGVPDLTVLYDNYLLRNDCRADWGFSCLITGMEKTILFDAGGQGKILLENMDTLHADAGDIDLMVISHNHSDHTGNWRPDGGVFSFLSRNSKVTIYLPPSVPPNPIKAVQAVGASTQVVNAPLEICKGVHLTGPMTGEAVEQSLILDTPKGLIVITGCAHQGVVQAVRKAKDMLGKNVYFVMGGFHLLGLSDSQVQDIVQQFRDLGVEKVGPSHCTGPRAIELFRQAYGKDFVPIGVGRINVD